ncbi:MAG: hypothetical protein RL033_5739 [Pseudomonadota bacterium]
MKKLLSPLPASATVPTESGRRRRRQQLGCTLGLLLAGCAERYDIGAVGDTPQDLQAGDAPTELAQDPRSPLGVLLADGIEDADARLEGDSLLGAPGDLDGDGFDDVMVATRELDRNPDLRIVRSHVLYGGPRPADGVVRLAQHSTELQLPESEVLLLPQRSLRGDFDGDGTNDVLFSTYGGGSFSYAIEEDDAQNQAELTRRTADQRALLWLGARERPAQVELTNAAVAFGDRDNLPSHFAQELAERDPAEAGYDASLSCQLSWLGDLDGDGLDDLALSSTFRVMWFREEYRPGTVTSVTTRQRRETISYIYYGGAQLVPGSEAPEPDVRLAGVTLTGMGDVNGDGFADLAVSSDGDSYYALPGRAQRLRGETAALQLAVPLAMPVARPPVSVGDLDGDGFSDVIALGFEGDRSLTQLVYGSAELLDRPIDASQISAIFSVQGPANDVRELGDYDGDGANDLLFWNVFFSGDPAQPSTLQPTRDELRLIRGGTQRFSGTYEVELEHAEPEGDERSGISVASTSAGDFDGDGRADVLMLRSIGDQTPMHIKFGGPLPERPLH